MSKTAHSAVLSLTRAVVGLLFACHGAQKLLGLFGGTRHPIDFGVWPHWWAGVIELVGGTLVMVGLATRPAAVVCSGSMAYAYFVVHQPLGLLPIQNKGEAAALFAWFFVLIAVLGPGRFALDTVLANRPGSRDRVVSSGSGRT
ncbi:DoxX family protein [Amycolatopsis anabasis]|uniref:DoxX family protein n=1 Tax=Amycolatopsis anabasis TaxID=1840409 RepID=UPI00131BBCDA|nr:DoxX family protein [Amycolatopsis anabasis]